MAFLSGLLVFWFVLFLALRVYRPTLMTYLRSFGEFSLIYLFGSLPLIIISVKIFLNDQSLTEIFESEGRPGQVIVYISAFLAPVVFTFLQNYKDARPLWHTIHFLLIFSCIIAGVLLFLEYGNRRFFESEKIDFFAMSLYFVSLSLWFFSIVYSRSLDEQNFSRSNTSGSLTRVVAEKGY